MITQFSINPNNPEKNSALAVEKRRRPSLWILGLGGVLFLISLFFWANPSYKVSDFISQSRSRAEIDSPGSLIGKEGLDTLLVGGHWLKWEIPPRRQFRFLVAEGDTLEMILGSKNGQKIRNIVSDLETKLPAIPGPPYIVWLRSQTDQTIEIQFLSRPSPKQQP